MSTIASRARRLLRSRSGALSVELVISLPVLALFYVGWAYFGLAYDAKNAVTRTAYSAAAMAALEPSINDAQMTALMVAAQSTLSTYAPSPQIVISDVALAPTGQWIVVWSDAAGGAASRPIGSGYAFSGNYGDGTTNRIVAEVRLSFSTPLAGLLRSISSGAINVPQTITLTDTYISTPLQPGNVARVLSSGVTLQ